MGSPFCWFCLFFSCFGRAFIRCTLGKYKTILFLSVIYCLGHCLLACMEVVGDTRVVLLLGLMFVAIGSGGIKPCVSAHVGDQFCSKNSQLLTKVFAWFYLSINLGAFLSGLLTPFLLEARRIEGSVGESLYPYFIWLVGDKKVGDLIFGHHYAFGLPGVLMAIATLLFWMGRKSSLIFNLRAGTTYRNCWTVKTYLAFQGFGLFFLLLCCSGHCLIR